MSNKSLQETFNGKRIFITGGSGFVGKALIEKLLRSCEGIKVIYVLLRENKGVSIELRLKAITENALFEKLKKKNPDVLKKLVPIYGDVKECRLGISDEDRQTLIDNVNIVYHIAASVRFDDFLKDSILMNTRGTREVVNLALEIKHLIGFIHISTTYCNTDKKVLEERIYPPHADWRSSIEIAEKLDQHTLNVMATKYIHPLPNTYTFAKSLAEHVVYDLCKGKIPAVIFRPSVVLGSHRDPIPGWVDNFNGPVGLLCAGGKGILKVAYGDIDSRQDYIPVDIVIKMIIMATRQRELNKDLDEVEFFNGAVGDEIICTNNDTITLGSKLTWDAPCFNLFWYPQFKMTNNWYIYYVTYLVYHMLPALLVDGLLKISGRKPMLTKIQRKVYIANMALIYFMRNSWKFINNKARNLSIQLPECDKKDFSFNDALTFNEQDLYFCYIHGKIGAMKYLFKEDFDFDRGFRNTMIMWILDLLVHYTIYAVACWYLYAKIDIVSILCRKCNDILLYWSNL